MSTFTYKDDILHCDNMPLREIAERYSTPLYVYSRNAILDNCETIERSFGGIPHLTTYAVKANSNLHILRLIAERGLGADVGSQGELFLALKAGFPPSKVSFSGVGKRDDEIAFALESDILAYNVESDEEIDTINTIAAKLNRTARILLRVNLDLDAGTHAYISTSKKQNKFGVASWRAVEVLKRAQQLPHIEIGGIHSHIGSQIVHGEVFVTAAKVLSALVDQVRASNIPVHDLDFGGGFGIQYHGFLSHDKLPQEKSKDAGSNAGAFISQVLPILRRTGCHLSIQPGRSIIANAAVLLTKVLYRKVENDKTFIIVDGGMNDLIRPSLYQAYHQIVPLRLSRQSRAPFETVDVVGPCCESGDFFAHERTLQKTERGDYLALMGAGAYGYVLSSNYNARLRPAEVLVEGESNRIIRQRETLEDLVS